MTGTIHPYPAYKDSSLPWLGKVPMHWEVKRAKRVFHGVDERSSSGAEELLSVSAHFGVVKRKSVNVTMFKAESYAGYKLCNPDDLVINSLWAWSYGLGVSRHRGIISTAYGVFRLLNPSDHSPEFYDYTLRSVPFNWELTVRSKGIWRSRYQLSNDSFLKSPIPVPPREEQDRIVRFLDSQVAKINRLVKIKKRQIALLQELKQAVVNRAVTRGLDPSVKLKPSGVDWLGEIPEHWRLTVGRDCLSVKKLPNTGLVENNVLSLSYGNIVVRPIEKQHGLVPHSFETYQIVEPQEIICRPTDLQNDKKSLRFGLSSMRGIITSAYLCFQTTCYVEFDYMYLLLHSYDLKKVFYQLGSGLRQNLSWDDFKNLPIPIPPIVEQKTICTFIQRHNSFSDPLIERENALVDRLIEYRTRLIADVVTGKLDVRGVDVPDEAGPGGDAATEEEDDEAGEYEGDPDGVVARLEVAE